MGDRSVQRRLAAVLAADVAGYTRLMEQDSDGTVAAWQDAREDVIKPRVAEFSGKIVKLTGDGFLVEFPTIQDAVRCAIAMQQGLVSSHLKFRMGVNLGDIIDDGEDIHGEGVNVAARIEALAEPGGINISGDVYNQIRNRIDARYEDQGEHEVKNVSAPVRVYAVQSTAAKIGIAEAPATAKPSIAVLPFDNLSGDPEQEYFSDGMSEDIITALSRIRQFFVIARNTTFTYKGQAVDVQKIAKEIGVRYVLEGSVRKAGGKVRITAQLIDGETGNHLWAEKYDRDLEDIFAVQDEVVQNVVGAIYPELNRAEQVRALAKSTENLSAWDLYQQGLGHLWRLTGDEIREAQKYFARATEIDPNFTAAWAYLSWSYNEAIIFRFAEDLDSALDAAFAAAEKAIKSDGQDALAHMALGAVYARKDRFAEGIEELNRAIEINPSLSHAHTLLAALLAAKGESERALDVMNTAMRLSPHDPIMFAMMTICAHAHLKLEEYEEAEAWAKKALRQSARPPVTYVVLISCLGHLGRAADVPPLLENLKSMWPDFSLTTLDDHGAFSFRGGDNFKLIEGLRKAGVPEN